MNIRIKKRHIVKGQVMQASACPIALAMMDAGLESPHAGPNSVSWTHHGNRFRRKAPQAVESFVKAFDRGQAVAPFEFEIKEAP